jgi:hypothetical protein
MVGPGAPIQSSIELYQLSYEYQDGTVHEHTDWGAVAVTFSGVEGLLYFSLTYNDSEVISNCPLLSDRGSGVEQTVFIPFPLGTASGEVVSEGLAEYELGTAPKAAAGLRSSSEADVLEVTQKTVGTTISASEVERFNADPVAAVFQLAPGEFIYDTATRAENLADSATAAPTTGELIAAAASTDLRYVNTMFNLGLGPPDKPIDLFTMQTACGVVTLPGSPAEQVDSAPHDWASLKEQYQREHTYEVVTLVTRSPEEALNALKNNFGVKLALSYPIANSMAPEAYQAVSPVSSMTMFSSGSAIVQELHLGEGFETWVRSLNRADKPGLYATTSQDFGGIADCYFIVDKPAQPQSFDNKVLYDFSALRNSSYFSSTDSNIHMSMYNFFSGELQIGELVSPLNLQVPAVPIATIDPFNPVNATTEVNGKQGVIFIADIDGDSAVKYWRDGATQTLFNDPEGDPVINLFDVDLFFDGVPHAAANIDGTVQVTIADDENGSSWQPFTEIVGSFCEGDLFALPPCELGGNPAIGADIGDSIRFYPNVDFATGETGPPVVLGTDVYSADMAAMIAKFAMTYVSPQFGVQFVESEDGSGLIWKDPVPLIPPPIDENTQIALGKAELEYEFGMVLFDPEGLKYFGGEVTESTTTVGDAELLEEIDPPMVKIKMITFFDEKNKQQVVVGPDKYKTHLHLYWCHCSEDE